MQYQSFVAKFDLVMKLNDKTVVDYFGRRFQKMSGNTTVFCKSSLRVSFFQFSIFTICISTKLFCTDTNTNKSFNIAQF